MGKWVFRIGGIAALAVAVYGYAAYRYSNLCGVPRTSCVEHRKAGCSIDGVYDLKVGGRTLPATCDMRTDEGGWTLVGNYLHKKANIDPVLSVLADRLPLQSSTTLGTDESRTPASWGHASNQLLSSFAFKEVRFRCRNARHDRLVDFSVNSSRCLEYFRTGKGTCLATPEAKAEFQANVRSLPGHGGTLMVADSGWADKGNYAITGFPFYVDWKSGWLVGQYWHCDEVDQRSSTDSHHQIYIR